MAGRIPEPTELIYSPADSWAPIAVAIGLALIAAGTFMGWAFAAVGAAFALAGAVSWWRTDEDEIAHMRLTQRTDTAVIPAEPIRRK